MFSVENITLRYKVQTEMPEDQPNQPEASLTEPVLDAIAPSEKPLNRMILIGAPAWVMRIIHLMHAAHITEVKEWSRPMPTRNTNEVISLMQRPKLDE